MMEELCDLELSGESSDDEENIYNSLTRVHTRRN